MFLKLYLYVVQYIGLDKYTDKMCVVTKNNRRITKGNKDHLIDIM